jgi:hypothetical protein
MDKRPTGHQFLANQLAQANATIAQLLDEIGELTQRKERPKPQAVENTAFAQSNIE